ncbi:hypothetical protein GCK32_016071 [Trichostrongylus colubriformis]|uniref:Uncharacterized protein n=1 Tax=Trichostrongylus colubriformis TaxID=6319 RepID=A0AAN8ILK4_TRICO
MDSVGYCKLCLVQAPVSIFGSAPTVVRPWDSCLLINFPNRFVRKKKLFSQGNFRSVLELHCDLIVIVNIRHLRRYLCLCEQLHIRKGSRLVAIFLNITAVVNLIFSVTRSSAVAVYSLMSSAFAVVIIGSLTYGVYKEKRMYLVPYLVFQLISIGMTMIVLVVLVIAIATNSTMVVELAKDIGNVDMNLDQQQLNHGKIYAGKIKVARRKKEND